MQSYKKDIEKLVKEFQVKKESETLLRQFEPFINKYYLLFTTDAINLRSYDIRFFLSCYLKEKEERGSLRRGRYHSTNDYRNAGKIISYLKQAFHGYSNEEVYHELIIPFLKCAKRYKPNGSHFGSYLYQTYKFELLRHLNTLLFATFDSLDPSIEMETEHHINFENHADESKLVIELDDALALNDPFWLNGRDTKDPFDKLKREERLILVKYYFEDYTDREIARLVGRNKRSINRARLRLIRNLKNDIKAGRVKWVRWKQL